MSAKSLENLNVNFFFDPGLSRESLLEARLILPHHGLVVVLAGSIISYHRHNMSFGFHVRTVGPQSARESRK